MNKLLLIFALSLFYSCSSRTPTDQSDAVISMQLIDRNGFTETISNKDRIASFKNTDFLTAQPFQKVLRVFGKNISGQSVSKITSYHENGQLWQYLEAVDGRAHGIYREWFPNGVLKIEAHLAEGTADIHDIAQATWIFHGHCKVWEEEGNLVAEFHYEKGQMDAPARYFYPDGKLQKIIPYEQGEIHGIVQSFDEEGNLMEETPYSKGEKEGKAIAYWNPTHPLSTEIFAQGLLSEAFYFDPLGNCIAEVHDGKGKQAEFKEGRLETLYTIENGIIEGEVQTFNPNGSLHTSYILIDEKKQGEEWEYYPSEKGEALRPKLCVHWNDDKIQGQVKTWYPNGKMESQREVNENKKHGTSFSWYKSGDLMLMEEYDNELLIKGSYYKPGDKRPISKIESGKGTASLYTSEGIFLRKVAYEKGKPVVNPNDTMR